MAEDEKYPFHPDVNLAFTSSNLSIVIIDLEIRMADKEEDERVPAQMKVIWNENGSRNNVGDESWYEGRIGIKYRGNSSYRTSPKKPFAIRTEDENGKKKAVQMLDMPADSDWALLAPYNDRSLIRDVLLFELMKGTFEYTPTGRHCELVLNGVYQGVYVLAARVRQGESRINLEAPGADEGDGLTGGYHLEMDRPDDPGFKGVVQAKNLIEKNVYPRVYYQYKYPDMEDLSEAQLAYIQSHVQGMERAVAGDDFSDPGEGFRAYLDTSSLVNVYIAQELTRDQDAYRLSMPLYKYPDSIDHRFKFSTWDYNGAMGMSESNDSWSSEGWAHNLNRFQEITGSIPVPWMFKRILQDELFYAYLKETWIAYRQERLSDQMIEAKMDSLIRRIDEGQDRNFAVWHPFNTYVWPNYYTASSWKDELTYLKDWLQKRATWIDSQWTHEEEINYVANGGFESAAGRGQGNGPRLAEWVGSSDRVLLSPLYPSAGEYSLSIPDKERVSQMLTEIPPGYYTVKARVKSSEPGSEAYFFHRYHDGDTALAEVVTTFECNSNYELVELSGIRVSNHFVEIGFGTEGEEGKTIHIDDVEFIRTKSLTANEPLPARMEQLKIRVDKDGRRITISLSGEQKDKVPVDIYDISGRLIHHSVLFMGEKTVSGLPDPVYIVRVGNTIRKIAF